MLESHDIRSLNVALASEVGPIASAILQAVKDAGNRATDGDTPADPDTAKMLLAKRLHEILRIFDDREQTETRLAREIRDVNERGGAGANDEIVGLAVALSGAILG